jgi:hypothetical protein
MSDSFRPAGAGSTLAAAGGQIASDLLLPVVHLGLGERPRLRHDRAVGPEQAGPAGEAQVDRKSVAVAVHVQPLVDLFVLSPARPGALLPT